MKRRFGSVGGAFVLVLVVNLATVQAEDAWLTGPALERQLAAPVGLRWQGMPLREALEHLAQAQHVAIFLDRRVDPGQAVQFEARDLALYAALQELAKGRNLGLAQLGPVFYFGPPAAAQRLRTVAAIVQEQAAKLPPAERKIFLERRSLSWSELATPRAILESLATENDLRIENLGAVPHDLWPAVSLPPLSIVERLTLVLIGFDLTFEIADSGKAIVITPIGASTEIVRTYTVGPEAETIAARFAAVVPQASLRAIRDQIVVRGRAEDHETIAAALRGEPVRRSETRRITTPGVQVYTLNVENRPLGPLVRQLCKQLGLELTMDDAALSAAGVDLDQLTSLEVKNAPLEKLLETLLTPHKLAYRLDGKRIEVFPAK